jgi:hypothetical protein
LRWCASSFWGGVDVRASTVGEAAQQKKSSGRPRTFLLLLLFGRRGASLGWPVAAHASAPVRVATLAAEEKGRRRIRPGKPRQRRIQPRRRRCGQRNDRSNREDRDSDESGREDCDIDESNEGDEEGVRQQGRSSQAGACVRHGRGGGSTPMTGEGRKRRHRCWGGVRAWAQPTTQMEASWWRMHEQRQGRPPGKRMVVAAGGWADDQWKEGGRPPKSRTPAGKAQQQGLTLVGADRGGSEPPGRRGERWPTGRGRRAVAGEGGCGRASARRRGGKGGPRRLGVGEGGSRRREPQCVRAQGVAAQARMGRSTDADRPALARSGGSGCILRARVAIPLWLLDLRRRTNLKSRKRIAACLLASSCWLGKKVSHSIGGGREGRGSGWHGGRPREGRMGLPGRRHRRRPATCQVGRADGGCVVWETLT